MKKITNIFTLYLIAIFLTNSVRAQLSQDMIKYWYYRDRLSKYFVVPGVKQGESQIVCVRNRIEAANDPNTSIDPSNKFKSKNVDYGQHGKYTGLYIGVLATEYYLLNKNGQYEDAAKTLNELNLALRAVKAYWDEHAEDILI